MFHVKHQEKQQTIIENFKEQARSSIPSRERWGVLREEWFYTGFYDIITSYGNSECIENIYRYATGVQQESKFNFTKN
jgi:hypothetical protein